MGGLIRLWDESKLLFDLRDRTIVIIRGCQEIGPIKKLVECHDILDMTIDIQKRFPTEFPDTPEYDVGAMNRLKHLTSEIFVWYSPTLPQPDFEIYSLGVHRLIHSFEFQSIGKS
jgi:hypothetical protein